MHQSWVLIHKRCDVCACELLPHICYPGGEDALSLVISALTLIGMMAVVGYTVSNYAIRIKS